MKKVFFAFIVLSISLATLAQGDSEPDQNSGDLDNQFYFRFGYSLPINDYFIFEVDDWEDISRFGYSFDMGSIFMFNSIPLPDGLRLGIIIDYLSINLHRFTYDEGDRIKLWKLAIKPGLTLSYSPVEDLVFDTYFKAQVPALGLVWEEDYFEDLYLATGGIGYATGLNVRYKFLMMGFEFSNVTMRFYDPDAGGDGRDYIEIPNGEGGYTEDLPLPTFNFVFGFSF